VAGPETHLLRDEGLHRFDRFHLWWRRTARLQSSVTIAVAFDRILWSAVFPDWRSVNYTCHPNGCQLSLKLNRQYQSYRTVSPGISISSSTCSVWAYPPGRLATPIIPTTSSPLMAGTPKKQCSAGCPGGTPSGAAAKLGIPPTTLDYRIKALNIDKSRFKFSQESQKLQGSQNSRSKMRPEI